MERSRRDAEINELIEWWKQKLTQKRGNSLNFFGFQRGVDRAGPQPAAYHKTYSNEDLPFKSHHSNLTFILSQKGLFEVHNLARPSKIFTWTCQPWNDLYASGNWP